MIIRTNKDLGLAIRMRRKELGWDQASLAQQIGVTRQWVIDIEKGKPRAELELAIRALNALGLILTAEPNTEGNRPAKVETTTQPRFDINRIVDSNRAQSRGSYWTLDSTNPVTLPTFADALKVSPQPSSIDPWKPNSASSLAVYQSLLDTRGMMGTPGTSSPLKLAGHSGLVNDSVISTTHSPFAAAPPLIASSGTTVPTLVDFLKQYPLGSAYPWTERSPSPLAPFQTSPFIVESDPSPTSKPPQTSVTGSEQSLPQITSTPARAKKTRATPPKKSPTKSAPKKAR